jgi:hypothetical protein
MNRRIKRAHALIGATALCLLVPIAVAASAGGSGGPEATASSVQKQVKKLTKRVRKLELQVGGLGKQQGPPGQDATKLFAYISDDTSAVTANVQYGSGVAAVSDPAGNGQYEVTFNRSLVNCVVHAQPGFGNPRAGGNAFPASIPFVNIAGGAPDGKVSVEFRDADNTTSVVDTSFLITAFC